MLFMNIKINVFISHKFKMFHKRMRLHYVNDNDLLD